MPDPTDDLTEMTPAAGSGNLVETTCAFVTAVIKDPNLDPAEKRRKVLAALKLLDDGPGDADGPDDEEEMQESLRRTNRRPARGHARLQEGHARTAPARRGRVSVSELVAGFPAPQNPR